MRLSRVLIVAAATLSAATALAQTSPPPASSPPPAQAAPPAVAPATGTTAIAPAGKRAACRQDTAAKGLRGQDQRDAMQLCVAQAQLDCVKDAIAQKTVGPQRRDFMKTCMGAMPRGRNAGSGQ